MISLAVLGLPSSGVAGLVVDTGVIIITVHIGADAVAVRIANSVAEYRGTGAVTVGIVNIVNGGGVPVITGAARVGVDIDTIDRPMFIYTHFVF